MQVQHIQQGLMMYKKMKKLPSYIMKAINKGNFSDFYEIIKNVRLNHLLIALAARVDNRLASINIRCDNEPIDINHFIDLLKLRRKRIYKDIYAWVLNGEQVFANYRQFRGLQAEYFTGIFADIYNYDFNNKTVLDIGGFVGDTALYFFKKGARKVIIYEPILKNVQALNYNLSHYNDKIEVYQQALADKNGLFSMFSSEPEGGLGFGIEKGDYQIQCQGIKMTDILLKHPYIDVVKIDCEGGEQYLLDLTKQEIMSVPYWIIETHTNEIYRNIVTKFQECGFSNVFESHLNSSVSLLHFRYTNATIHETI